MNTVIHTTNQPDNALTLLGAAVLISAIILFIFKSWLMYKMVRAIYSARITIRSAHKVYLNTMAYFETVKPQWIEEYNKARAEGLEAERRQAELRKTETKTETKTYIGVPN